MKRCSTLWIFLICMSAWHHQHLCMSACITDPWVTYSKQLTGHELCMVCAGKWLVGSGDTPPPRGGLSLGDGPPPGGGGGRLWGGGGAGQEGGRVASSAEIMISQLWPPTCVMVAASVVV